ncbi:MAG: DUF1501 domain-containing protein, partial [Planctomycetaceae bacterium]
MFDVGGFRATTCGGVSRRSFLRLGASAAAGLGLGVSPRIEASAESGRAKSVILLWLWGAPSHLDMFDPKPDAPLEYRGPFTPIDTRMPGVQFTELLPRLAQCSDKFALVRSMQSKDTGHVGSGTTGLTGFPEGAVIHPNFGSIIAKHTLKSRGTADLPPFFAIGPGIPRDAATVMKGYGGGRLGAQYDPFMIDCLDTGEVKLPALQLLDGLSPHRLDDRRTLLTSLDDSVRTLDRAGFDSWNRTFQSAYGLLTRPETRRAFDLTCESDDIRARYGYTSFGQSCLLARRLVEAHVPYIQVNWSHYVEAMTPHCDVGWDTHIFNFEHLQDRLCPIFDRVMPVLLADLEDRGLLNDTLVIAMGEFGRAPKINPRAARDHWANAYFSLWAGAGVAPGRVIGETDRLGEHPLTPAI